VDHHDPPRLRGIDHLGRGIEDDRQPPRRPGERTTHSSTRSSGETRLYLMGLMQERTTATWIPVAMSCKSWCGCQTSHPPDGPTAWKKTCWIGNTRTNAASTPRKTAR